MSDEDTYGIFVRNLVAKDETGNNNLTLIDQTGCPVESKLMREVRTIDKKSKSLESFFEAFSFTGSSTLELEADVETCLERCRPVQCQVASGRSEDDYDVVVSYGRKRRSIKARNQPTGQPIDTKRMSKTLSIRAAQFGLDGSTDSIGKAHYINGVLITRATSNSLRKTNSNESNMVSMVSSNDASYDKETRPLALETDSDYDLSNHHNLASNYEQTDNNSNSIEDETSIAAAAAASIDEDKQFNNNHNYNNGNDDNDDDDVVDPMKVKTGFNLLEPTTLATFMGIMIIIQTLLLIIGLIVASRLRQSNQQQQHKIQSTDHFVSIYKP
uniref:ZP domain-containing protein n=2 Tax=Tetranychus urticae TaxID=32264 RepID=T1K7E8_TETUR